MQERHSELSATTSRKVRTFRSGSYLEGLMAELDRAAISLRMGEARETAGLTQPEIAELLTPPVHFRTVQDWESPKKHVVPFDRLDEWARLTQTTREWLLYGEPAEEPTTPADLARVMAALEAVTVELNQAVVALQRLRADELPQRRATARERH